MSIYAHGQSGVSQKTFCNPDSIKLIVVNQDIFNFPDSIKMIYALHLLPTIDNAVEEVVSYWSNYDDRDDQPEYTLRITKGKDNQHYLEGRFLTQRIDKIITSMRYTGGRYPIEVRLFSIPVSDTFTQNMRLAFVKTIECQKLNKVYNGPVTFDGVCYKFRIKNDNNELLKVSLCEPEVSNPCYNTIVLCKQMAKDLKNKSFEESKYIDKLK